MFLRSLSGFGLFCACAISAPAFGAPLSAPVATGSVVICAKLASDYDQVEKSLAMTEAEGIGDNSAPRETSRQVEQSNFLARASMALTLMQAHHCTLPDHAPSVIRYLSSALTCTTDRLKTSQPDSCKMEDWHAGE
jgi:hypothetical protein